MSLLALVDTSKTSLFLSLASITFNPTAWNIVARNGKPVAPPDCFFPGPELTTGQRISQQDHHPPSRRQRLPRLLLPRRVHFRRGDIARPSVRLFSPSFPLLPPLGPPIFPPSSHRIETQLAFSLSCPLSRRYRSALLDQPRVPLLPAPLDVLVPMALFVAGQTFVVSSTWALGVTGTFLGDYFGILMDHRVEGFPFNVLRDPMYVGSTMCFAATALWCVYLLRGACGI